MFAQLVPFVLVVFFCLISHSFAGECVKVSSECIEGKGTREVDGYSVTRDCFRYRDSYRCSGFAANNCALLAQAGCVQVDAACLEYKHNWCVNYKKIFKCEKEEESITKETRYRLASYKDLSKDRKRIKCSEKIVCGDGKCIDQSYEISNEMGKALSILKSLQEMEKSITFNPITVFGGREDWCKKRAYGLNNCCRPGNKKQTVEKMNLSHCTDVEKELAKKKDAGQCHFLGIKKEKIAGITKNKKYVYCCFENSLVKEIQVQGRLQLGKSFGDLDNPDCGGMSLLELQALNFEEMDLSLVFKDIFDRYNLAASHLELDRIGASLEQELRVIESSINQPSKVDREQLNGSNHKYDDEGLL